MIPANAVTYLPLLIAEAVTNWPKFPDRVFFAGQVEQETCPSLTSKKCWNPRTELKTSREYGFGLGQLTVTARFDNFKEALKLPGVGDWKWEDRYNPRYQLRVLVLMDKACHDHIRSSSAKDHRAMMWACYNGGLGGVYQDQKVCDATPGCNRNLWWGNVEHTSPKAKIAASGYGKSFFDINREYVYNIERVRWMKYLPYMTGDCHGR